MNFGLPWTHILIYKFHPPPTPFYVPAPDPPQPTSLPSVLWCSVLLSPELFHPFITTLDTHGIPPVVLPCLLLLAFFFNLPPFLSLEGPIPPVSCSSPLFSALLLHRLCLLLQGFLQKCSEFPGFAFCLWSLSWFSL